jgi:hypothetical protein
MLFDDWSNEEWQKFDNFMIQCVQYYLKNGLQVQKHKNLEERKYITETSQEFHGWTKEETSLPFSVKLFNNETFGRFIDENQDYKNRLQLKTFKKWVKKYCEVNGFEYHNHPNQIFNNQRYFYITKKGVVFFRNINENTLEVPSQKEVKKWIGENEPDKYIKYFGEVEEG